MSEQTVQVKTTGKILQSPCGPIIHGLEDVLIKSTSISDIDGEKGILWYRGYRIEELARLSTYEEVSYLILYGRLPTKRELEDYINRMKKYRELHPATVEVIRNLAKAHPMFALEAAVAAEGAYDEDNQKLIEALSVGRYKAEEKELAYRIAEKLVAKMPTIVAYHYRFSRGLEVVRPRDDLGHAANFLYMMFGREPDPLASRGIDLYLILHADHEVPASTFAAHVVASTLSDLYSSVAAAIAALKGPLHGGANEMAVRNYLEIGTPAKAKEIVEAATKPGGPKLMGVGHRVYKAYDPRAKIFKEFSRDYVAKFGDPQNLFAIASAIEQEVLSHPYFQQRKLYPNVDFWSGIAFYYMGIPYEYFTPIFAMSRVVGWVAHVLEYWENNRIFRPRACYIGPHDLQYIPLEQR
ncbi:citrate synthase/methylcitrate synthase [Pyrobaculum aerophilum]|uniref:Citrate synthase n=2 Tax=Pyrobaculum aerophilum TaxID=13773 RepID=Q8ZWP2_PYRAE|nr:MULTISPECIES: citrate synthase/methylcitrate synthase [Pyrobaculum]2IBP_A Chain A, Citrate synthase [Pyrobaculum aerophilum str. IM2]2IBP_B Chain B, Citrate synthase [Pyrobaculum aerophilum str. IM2]AAL63658.1 citrate synthase [Pyrobaculum aerophilum str. IM2]MCX8136452.1 citrate synthase/methylcitrate synthase [Pyrobaculum aerophilum]HII46006.1 citrate synthase/methylcitrate synthase [Pyrobaculum aerophilum]